MSPEQWREIAELYQAAMSLAPRERATLLDTADPEIRSRVERMLAVQASGEILDSPASAFLGTTTERGAEAGTDFGPYRIESLIGAGGMGTVYRAVDTRLGRIVAIKVAATRYGERFQREAQAISRLNHPHVCTLYDVGPYYLVMELIEGSTLAMEIQKGPLPPESAARYGAQIAGALAEAHAGGIVHRDLKPANIMLTRHGVKVLDFGIARMPTGANITEVGAIVGTPAYMSPEQAAGREPASQTDQFALGLILYEMLVGRLPHPGASLGQMIAHGPLQALPLPSRARTGVPASLDRLVGRLLAAEPAERPDSTSVARELAEIAAALANAPGTHASPYLSSRYLAATAVLVLLAIAGLLVFQERTGKRKPAAQVSGPYKQITSFTDSAVGPVLSPDGRMLAFYRSDNSFLTPDQIWVKLLPDGEPVQITHDPRLKYGIAFSPDSTRIAYTTIEQLRLFETETVSSLGGDSQPLLTNAAGLSWLPDGRLLFSQIKTGLHMGIVTAKPDRSQLREIYFPLLDRGMAHYSYLSPDKRWLLVVEMEDQFGPCRLVPFAGDSRGKQVGPPGVCTSAAWSLDGKWMYFGAQVTGRRHLWRQRFPDGQPEQITFGSTEEDGLAMDPDGNSLITSISTQQNSVWFHDKHGERSLSSQGYAEPTPPVFSADGKRLYYLLRRDSPESAAELCRTDLSSGKTEVVVPGVSMAQFDISNNEKAVVFSTQPSGQPSELWMAPLDRSSSPRRIAESGEASPYFGPNGEILFRLTEGRNYYLGAMAPDGTGKRKVFPSPVLGLIGVSPDRSIIIFEAAVAGNPNLTGPLTLAVPLDGGPAKRICEGPCTASWSRDSRYFYVDMTMAPRENSPDQTIAVRVPPGQKMPAALAAADHNSPDWEKIRGIEIVERGGISPGPDPSTYAYVKSFMHANLFRIPLP